MMQFTGSCEDTSPLISEMMDHRVSLCTRVRVKIHLALCEFCGYYKNQLETLRRLARRLGQEESESLSESTLSAACKERMKQRIESENK